MNTFGQILVGTNPNRPNIFRRACKMYYTIYLVKWSNFMDFNSSRSMWGGHLTTTWTKFYPIFTPSPLEWTTYHLSRDSHGISTDPLPPPSFCPRSYWMDPVCCRRNWKPRHTHVIIVFFLHLQSECRRRPPRHAPLSGFTKFCPENFKVNHFSLRSKCNITIEDLLLFNRSKNFQGDNMRLLEFPQLLGIL